MKQVPVIIIGAGPAGMAAAKTLAKRQIPVLILDEQVAAGGQIYRAVERVTESDPDRAELLGEEYCHGQSLATGLQDNLIQTVYQASVWRIDADGTVSYSKGGQARQCHAEYIIVATGAQERPFAFAGWTLPGVMTAGAAQIMLKAHGMVAENAILAGNGPLLYLIAQQMLKAGNPPQAILETQTHGAWKNALPHLPAALYQGKGYLWKGVTMLAALKKAGIPHYRGISQLTATGGNSLLEAITFTHQGKQKTLNTQHLFVHQGVIPNTQITRSLQLQHHWNAQQQAWQATCDEWGITSQSTILLAGDGAGIGGAKAAEMMGEIVALQVCHQLQHISQQQRNEQAAPLQRKLKAELAVRPFLDQLYAPDHSDVLNNDDIMVCRCEEVSAGQLRDYVRLGCLGLNQMKSFSRCGMGPCQGRQCGITAANVVAAARGVSPETVDYYRIRAPIKPVSLGELASLAKV